MPQEAHHAGPSGERLAFARLPTGVRVIGVNAGYTFAFVREATEELRWAAVAAEGSQFRSRDLFPQTAAAIALGRPEALAEQLHQTDIPGIPARCIAYIDGYGNLKTTIRLSDSQVRSGSIISVRIGAIEREAIASDGSFAVEPGRLAFAPGSSGWRYPRDGETRWMELFLRGGSAWETFERPAVGELIQISA